MVDGKFPWVKWAGKWSPICGHWFWNNNYGATLFCKKLDSKYTSGTIKRRTDRPLKDNGLKIGSCGSTDKDLDKCTAGGNTLSTTKSGCAKDEKASVEINCFLPSSMFSISLTK